MFVSSQLHSAEANVCSATWPVQAPPSKGGSSASAELWPGAALGASGAFGPCVLEPDARSSEPESALPQASAPVHRPSAHRNAVKEGTSPGPEDSSRMPGAYPNSRLQRNRERLLEAARPDGQPRELPVHERAAEPDL